MCFRRSVLLLAGCSWRKAYGCHHAAGRQDADDWLNFMLSQKNLWPTFTTRGTLIEEVSEQVFHEERRRLQAKHLWMEVQLRWRVLADRMYIVASTGKCKEELDALLFDRAARRSHTNPYGEKPCRGPALKEVRARWEQCKDWSYKDQSVPVVFDFQSLLKALSDKEAEAHSDDDAFTVPVAFSEARFQVKKSACFWRHGRYQE